MPFKCDLHQKSLSKCFFFLWLGWDQWIEHQFDIWYIYFRGTIFFIGKGKNVNLIVLFHICSSEGLESSVQYRKRLAFFLYLLHYILQLKQPILSYDGSDQRNGMSNPSHSMNMRQASKIIILAYKSQDFFKTTIFHLPFGDWSFRIHVFQHFYAIGRSVNLTFF